MSASHSVHVIGQFRVLGHHAILLHCQSQSVNKLIAIKPVLTKVAYQTISHWFLIISVFRNQVKRRRLVI